MSKSKTNSPVHRIHIGSVSVSIFANQSQLGKTFHSAQFDRSYLDGDEWKHTRSFGRDDLLVLAKLADQAHSWIVENREVDGESPEPN
ncbi:hypothetical protein M4951_16625 [Blastopirellula sp. J2-11]|uniref:hypothetical protein n=1 Tax=Blastopirellula sp. J2-11 TaxID=2943192 RepID=UPI0021C8C542|nr:hypothetical protein [Blastopirellula sp. J2-11]UUO05005.1 hypothetical protein M4951_16625 [Blastopirellula sp. J2-11]